MSDWVAFNSDGFPIAFADPSYTMAKFAKYAGPNAVEIRHTEGDERIRLLKIHAGCDPDQPWPS